MHATNITTFAQSVSFFESISYLNRLIGLVGVILNVLVLIVMSNKSLLHPLYNFFRCRQFVNLIVCVLGCGWVDQLDIDIPNAYSRKFYVYYIFGVPFRTAMTSSAISDLILSLNRYYIITNRTTFLIRISKLRNLAICLLFPICIYIPYFFIYEIQSTNNENEFVLKLTDLSNSIPFRVYLVATGLFEPFISILALGFVNTLSAIYFRKNMIRKGHLLKNRTTTKRTEVAYTKTVFILSTICFVTRTIDALVAILVRLTILKIIKFSDVIESRIMFLHEVSCLLILSAHAFDIIVYIAMDSNLRRCTQDFFRQLVTRRDVSSIKSKL